MQIYIARGGQSSGPYSEEQIRTMLAQGSIGSADLYWHEGMPAWQPLGQFGAPPVMGAPAPIQPIASTCQYAGFWLRFGAWMLDTIVAFVGIVLVAFAFGILLGLAGIHAAEAEAIGKILGVILYWLYFAVQESSPAQATLGKRVCGIMVTDLDGRRLTFARATGRHFGKLLSNFTIGIGYAMAGWTERKQALHDMLADCLVVKK